MTDGRELGELQGYHNQYLEYSCILAVHSGQRVIPVLIMMVEGRFDFHDASPPLCRSYEAMLT